MTDTATKLKDISIVVSTHIYATGAATDLKDFLVNSKAKKFLYIYNPLFYDPNIPGSGYELYDKGKLVKKVTTNHIKLPLFISFIIHSIYTIYWSFTASNTRWDIFIGSNNLNAFLGLVLKNVKKVKKSIYYVIDYNPYKYTNFFANWFYHFIEIYSTKYSDVTWNLSSNMIKARKTYKNFTGGNQIVVPIGIWYDRFLELRKIKKDYNKIAYMGHVIKRNGIQHFLNAIPLILKKIPKLEFIIIGGGDYMNELKQLCKKLKIQNVNFSGFVSDHRNIEKMLAECVLAVALYDKNVELNKPNLTNFADPAKLKSYLASGLPIIMTNVPHIANDLESKECGIIVGYNKEEIAEKTIALLSNKKLLNKMIENANKYASKYDWNTIFTAAFKEVI